MRYRYFSIFACIALLFASAPSIAAPSPTDQLQGAVDQIMALLENEQIPDDQQVQQIEDIIRGRFDFRVMSQWVLGPHWRQATAEQRDRFTEKLTRLLEATYRGRLEEYAAEYAGESVVFVDERVREDRAEVDTLIITRTAKHPVNYRLILRNGQWMVYDVVIEGVSLVRTYRTSYDEIVRREGMERLLQRMDERIRELRGGAAPESP